MLDFFEGSIDKNLLNDTKPNVEKTNTSPPVLPVERQRPSGFELVRNPS